jgi:hypothetical protein
MADLETRLVALGRELAFPATPNLVPTVRARLLSEQAHRRPLSWRIALAVAAALAIALGALAAIPSTRDAIAGFFHLKGLIIQRVQTNPTPAPTRSQSSIGERLNLGKQATLEQAQASLPYRIVIPHGLGPPDLVYLIAPSSTKAVALVYLPRPALPQSAQTGVGALVIEFPGQVQPELFAKMLGPDATLEDVTVNGNPGYWIGGAPHGFFFIDAQGVTREDTFRLAGNTLIWDQGRLTIRIEADLSQAAVLQLATSTR